MFFSYIAFWSSCRVTPDLGEVHARRAEFGHVFPEGRNLEGGMLRRRNPGRNPPEDRIEVWVFKKRRNRIYPFLSETISMSTTVVDLDLVHSTAVVECTSTVPVL